MIINRFENHPRVGQWPDYTHWMLDGCIGWYPFMNDGQRQLLDVSQYRAHATMGTSTQAALWTVESPPRGWAFEFDGANTDDSAVTGAHPWHNVIKDFTVMTWINIKTHTNFDRIAAHGEYQQDGWHFALDTTTNDRYVINTSQNSPGANQRSSTNNGAQLVGTWQHVAASRIGSSAVVYLNGIAPSSPGLNDSMLDMADNSARTLQLARGVGGNADVLHCQLKDFRYFNRGLKQQEIMEIIRDPWAPFRKRFVGKSVVAAPGGTVVPYYYTTMLGMGCDD